MSGTVRSYTDPRRLLRYALDNPRRAALIAAVVVAVAVVSLVALTVSVVPTWIAGYAFGLALLGFAYPAYKRVRLIRATTAASAASLAPGPTKLRGTVRPATEDLLQAPHSGTDCVAYRRVRKRSHGENTTRDIETDSVPFYVEDDTGRALVDPTGGTLDLKHDEGTRFISLASRGTEESSLEPGDTVAVYGEVVRPDVQYDGRPDESDSGQGDDQEITYGLRESTEHDGQDQGSETVPEEVSFGFDAGEVPPGTIPDDADVPPEQLPEGVASVEELLSGEGVTASMEDVPPQYREYVQRTMAQSSFPVTTGDSGDSGESAWGADAGPRSEPDAGDGVGGPGGLGSMVRGMAEAAADFPGRYDHLLADEEYVLGRGPAHEAVLITDKGRARVYGRQVLVALAVVGVSLAVVGGSAASMLGIY